MSLRLDEVAPVVAGGGLELAIELLGCDCMLLDDALVDGAGGGVYVGAGALAVR